MKHKIRRKKYSNMWNLKNYGKIPTLAVYLKYNGTTS